MLDFLRATYSSSMLTLCGEVAKTVIMFIIR
jgi:hypothetical protein